MAPVRPFLYYDAVVSVCNTCLRRVEGRVVFRDAEDGRPGGVWMDKWCPRHGHQHTLLADDVDWYRKCREVYLKKPEMPHRFNTERRWGCPYDCGLCPEHMQHSCLSLVEVTDLCNLACPVCYADSGPHRPSHRSLAEIEGMLDLIVRNEKEPDVVQISGGEPTLHPQLWEILDAARRRPVKHLMLNTNGLRIAREEGMAERLAAYQPGFEVYLQLDSLRPDPHRELRGQDLLATKLRALERLEAANVSTTLVVTLKRGLNDDEVGELIRFGLGYRCVRGVTFQPVQHAGRTDGYDTSRHRLTISEVRRRIVEQSGLFSEADVLPVPCNPDCLAMAYALKLGGKVTPLTGLFDPRTFIEGSRNTIVYEKDDHMRGELFRLFATNHSPESQAGCLSDLLCCLPQIEHPPEIGYANLFRVIIMQFIDAESFDLRAVRKSCVHIATPRGELIPFDTYNLFYRDGRREMLARLREEQDRVWEGEG